jgi:hypothetical protein
MEPPGQRGGSVFTFTEHQVGETYHDPKMLERAGLSVKLASKDYCAIHRFSHCVISLYRAEPGILDALVLGKPRAWVQIWPAIGTRFRAAGGD